MRVTQVSLAPTQASIEANRPALTPELLAATGARYSRSNDGLEAILAKIDPANPEKSVDSIFRMVDYGHASIADMAPVAMFMDGISMWLAYHVWSVSPVAGGQESSTRYIRLSMDNLPDPNEIGIPQTQQNEWKSAMQSAFNAYEAAVEFWEDVAAKNPSVTRIPTALLNDESEKAQKTVARMKRNYAFDRARYFLPAALKTNVMLVQSARAWVSLCQQLLSHPLPEAQKLGEQIKAELALVAPRLIKHAQAQNSWQKALSENAVMTCQSVLALAHFDLKTAPDDAYLEVFEWNVSSNQQQSSGFALDLEHHDNRYAFIGKGLQMTGVRFGWNAVTFGDIRDLNRHRTGSKFCPRVPLGFYGALDQCDESSSAKLSEIIEIGFQNTRLTLQQMSAGEQTYIYWTLLGTQFHFEHLTTADKFIYEAELRTGVGAHYRYAKHLRDVLQLWYEKFPDSKGLILEGSAEPE